MDILKSLKLKDKNFGTSTGSSWWANTTNKGEIISYNPTDGKIIGSVYNCSESDYEQVIAESHKAFKRLLSVIDDNIMNMMLHVSIAPHQHAEHNHQRVVQGVEKKVGRNDPCPCGAVNPENNQPYKYKKCGLINAPYHIK